MGYGFLTGVPSGIEMTSGTISIGDGATSATINGLSFTPKSIILVPEFNIGWTTLISTNRTFQVTAYGSTSAWTLSVANTVTSFRYQISCQQGVLSTVAYSAGQAVISVNASYPFYGGTYRYIVW